MMDAIVLCGGRGSRLASVVSDLPKPLAPVADRPFLDYVLDYLRRSGRVSRVILATGYLAEQINTHFGNEYAGMPLVYSQEDKPLGTGGAILLAMRRFSIDSPFLILNGDSFVDVDLAALERSIVNTHFSFAMSLFRVADTARFGTVVCDEERVTRFGEKTGGTEPGLINAGVYIVRPQAFADWSQIGGMLSLEQVILPALVGRGAVTGVESGTRFIDIGIPATYAAAEDFFRVI